MKVRISEVWNDVGQSRELAVIEVPSPHLATLEVIGWILRHRPDLSIATDLYAHGYHAVEVKDPHHCDWCQPKPASDDCLCTCHDPE